MAFAAPDVGKLLGGAGTAADPALKPSDFSLPRLCEGIVTAHRYISNAMYGTRLSSHKERGRTVSISMTCTTPDVMSAQSDIVSSPQAWLNLPEKAEVPRNALRAFWGAAMHKQCGPVVQAFMLAVRSLQRSGYSTLFWNGTHYDLSRLRHVVAELQPAHRITLSWSDGTRPDCNVDLSDGKTYHEFVAHVPIGAALPADMKVCYSAVPEADLIIDLTAAQYWVDVPGPSFQPFVVFNNLADYWALLLSSPADDHGRAPPSSIMLHMPHVAFKADGIRDMWRSLHICANGMCPDGRTLRDKGLRACARCHTAAYCSKDCQNAHWPAHKKDCSSSALDRVATAFNAKRQQVATGRLAWTPKED